MKSKFNKNWNSSVQPRKQRKFLFNAPNHIKRKLLSAHLSKDLRKKYNTRAIEVIKNDEVKTLIQKINLEEAIIANFEKFSGKLEGIFRDNLEYEDAIALWEILSKYNIVNS